MEAAAGSSDKSENFLPHYTAYANNWNFNLSALNTTEQWRWGVTRAVTQI